MSGVKGFEDTTVLVDGKGGEVDDAAARVGLVSPTNEGQQVLGTCSPVRLPAILASYRSEVEKAWTTETAHPGFAGSDSSPVGQCGVTSAWLQERLQADHGLFTYYTEGTVYLGTEWRPVEHVWLADLAGGIYDLTADQFEHPVMAYASKRQLMRHEVKQEPVSKRLRVLREAL